MSAETRESTSKRLFIGGDWADAEDGRTFEDRDPFTGMFFRELTQTIHVQRRSFGCTFSLRNHIIGITAILLEFLWKAVAHLLSGQPMENPKIPLAQAGIDQDSVTRACTDDLSCFDGASQVAAVKRQETVGGQTLGKSMGLLNSALGKFAVQMALMAAIGIPDRLAMANDDEVCRSGFQNGCQHFMFGVPALAGGASEDPADCDRPPHHRLKPGLQTASYSTRMR